MHKSMHTKQPIILYGTEKFIVLAPVNKAYVNGCIYRCIKDSSNK